MRFITENLGTIAAGAIVFAIAALAALKLIRDRRKGKTCSCGCENCGAKTECK